MKCTLCQTIINREQSQCFIHPNMGKITICKSCGKTLIEALFNDTDFNEWLDSFIQSRIEKYIPNYNEYLVRYNKKKCPDCKGTGFINGMPCKLCGFIGVIDA